MASRLRSALRRRVVGVLKRLLTKPLRTYEQRIPNSLANLKEQLCPGDVILVEGDQRVSQVIRYLTQSSWSHSALYIGDELRRFTPERAAALLAEHGAEARHLIIEATVEHGVACAPVAKYINYNLRVCRPRGLRRQDLDHVLEEVTGQIGRGYNVRHIFELGRFFFPVSLIPRRFRRAALVYGGETTRRVICTTMLARAFAHIGYPIVPRVTVDEVLTPHTWFGRLVGRNGHSVRALYSKENPALVTPRDFDLSPYFEIIKFNHLAGGKFDYRRIEWASDEERTPAGTPASSPPPLAAARAGKPKTTAA
ncbi:MAG TPA: YiiX/YebB-like N1pC/P60 family cysteine hydrolase [Candidatus Margulisiibacteriota bacterium]|nr:YiiX/YebB-like N1pC/P60 family cysteine hydrolase [Candidatus Margulisiibacteriota bacterium]